MCDASAGGAGSRGGTTTLADASGRRCPGCMAKAERAGKEVVLNADGSAEAYWLGFKKDAHGKKVLDANGEPVKERLTASNSIGGPVREVEAWFVTTDGDPRHIDDPGLERKMVRPEGFLSMKRDAIRQRDRRHRGLMKTLDAFVLREGLAAGRLSQGQRDALHAERNPADGSMPAGAPVSAADYAAEAHFAVAFGAGAHPGIKRVGDLKDLGWVRVAETEVVIHGRAHRRQVVATFPEGPDGTLPSAQDAKPTLYGSSGGKVDAATDAMDRIESHLAADDTLAERLDEHLRIADEATAVRTLPKAPGFDEAMVEGSNTGWGGGTGLTGTHGKVRDLETTVRGGSHLLGGIPASEALRDRDAGKRAFDAISAAMEAGETPTQEEQTFWTNYALEEIDYA